MKTLKVALAACAVIGIAVALSPSAKADDDEGDWHGRGWERHHDHRAYDRPVVVYGDPGANGYDDQGDDDGYGPPVYVVPRPRHVHAYPQPAWIEPSINLVFPLNLR